MASVPIEIRGRARLRDGHAPRRKSHASPGPGPPMRRSAAGKRAEPASEEQPRTKLTAWWYVRLPRPFLLSDRFGQTQLLSLTLFLSHTHTLSLSHRSLFVDEDEDEELGSSASIHLYLTLPLPHKHRSTHPYPTLPLRLWTRLR